MKIHTDRIETPPKHRLSVRDVKFILKSVPPPWLNGLTEVRLANSLEYYEPYAFFSRYDGKLTIYSRTGSKKQALRAMLHALAGASLGIQKGIRRRQSEVNRHRLDQIIQPLVDQLLPML